MACKIMMAEGPNEESNMRIYIMLIVLGSASGVALSQDAIVTTRSMIFLVGDPEPNHLLSTGILSGGYIDDSYITLR